MVYILYIGGIVELFMTIMEPNDTVLYFLKYLLITKKTKNYWDTSSLNTVYRDLLDIVSVRKDAVRRTPASVVTVYLVLNNKKDKNNKYRRIPVPSWSILQR